MKRMLFVFASLALFTHSVLAAPGGLPALQDQVASLQAQVNALAAGDGTAEAIVGTWTGEQNSLVLDRAVKQASPGGPFISQPFFHVFGHVDGGIDIGLGPGNFDQLDPFFHFQHMGAALCGGLTPTPAIVDCFAPRGMTTVGMNPNFWIVKGDRGPLTLTLARDGAKGLTGCTAAACPDSTAASLRGAVVGGNFFVLKIVAPGTGPCGTGVFQGTASLNADRTRMTFSGGGVDSDCSHRIFSLNMRRP